jgi:hypothetical protein
MVVCYPQRVVSTRHIWPDAHADARGFMLSPVGGEYQASWDLCVRQRQGYMLTLTGGRHRPFRPTQLPPRAPRPTGSLSQERLGYMKVLINIYILENRDRRKIVPTSLSSSQSHRVPPRDAWRALRASALYSQIARQDAHVDLEELCQLANHLAAEGPLSRQDFGDRRLGDPRPLA